MQPTQPLNKTSVNKFLFWRRTFIVTGALCVMLAFDRQIEAHDGNSLVVRHGIADVHTAKGRLSALFPDKPLLAATHGVHLHTDSGNPLALWCVSPGSGGTCFGAIAGGALNENTHYKVGYFSYEDRTVKGPKVLASIETLEGKILLSPEQVLQTAKFAEKSAPRFLYGLGCGMLLVGLLMWANSFLRRQGSNSITKSGDGSK